MKTEIFTRETLDRAAEILNNSGIVAFPTETVYGLGAVATDPIAVAKVFEAKKRPSFDPLIVHIADKNQITSLVQSVPEKAQLLMDKFWPGPLTIILPKNEIIPDIVTSGLPNVAVRFPVHPIAQKLIALTGKPIAAPSANLFSRTSPTSAAAVLDMLDGAIDGVVDEGECEVGIESTVISFAEEKPTLLRPGGITVEQLEQVIGKIEVLGGTEKKATAPGRSLRHYAPTAPMYLNIAEEEMNKNGAAQLCFSDKSKIEGFQHYVVLSPTGDLREAAHNLYSSLRKLSSLDIDRIYAETVPNNGLGVAINDRIKRASENGFEV